MADRPPDAWEKITSSDELRGNLPADRTAPVDAYDFASFFPEMGRVIMGHGRGGWGREQVLQ